MMRREGWQNALKEQGIAPLESWVGTGSPDMQGGEAAMVELLGRNLQLTLPCLPITTAWRQVRLPR